MSNQAKRWEVLFKGKVSSDKIVEVLLKNRGIKDKKDFFDPIDPMKIKLETLGISKLEISKAIKRIKQAKNKDEHVIIYGDYDADGISGTATLWETLHELGIFVLPHIPERFSEGYGLNLESVKKLKEDDPKLTLIITVDHGITVGSKVDEVKKLGIDMIITDHHQIGKKMPKPLALIYTDKIGGSALAWFFAREISKKFKINNLQFKIEERLELAAIGTIADQLPLIGPNRSVVKYGLEILNHTKRPGLLALFEEARIEKIGVYEVGYIIAPRINAMGRLKHGIESLRLLCTKDKVKAFEIAKNIGSTNSDRQKMVDRIMATTLSEMKDESKGLTNKVIVIASENYHEGIIGLAAGRLVEEFYRPAIVLSVKGEISKASARSISGFNIIEAIRKLEGFYIEGGGHPMAAGFLIETKKINIFTKEINKIAKEFITEDMLQRKLKIDLEIDFKEIDLGLIKELTKFEPTGLGNPAPTFVSDKVEISEIRSVGREAKHLKLKLKQNEYLFDAIFFGGGKNYSKITSGANIDIAYQIEENIWNGYKSIQLKIKDLKI